MSDEITAVVKGAVKSALEEHHICIFDPEERQLLKDFIKVGGMFKSAILRALVVGSILIVAAVILSFTHAFNWFK